MRTTTMRKNTMTVKIERRKSMLKKYVFATVLLCCGIGLFATPAMAQNAKKPNIVVIWGDDIGRDNLSVFSKGMMGT